MECKLRIIVGEFFKMKAWLEQAGFKSLSVNALHKGLQPVYINVVCVVSVL
jgi:hypothetical protein